MLACAPKYGGSVGYNNCITSHPPAAATLMHTLMQRAHMVYRMDCTVASSNSVTRRVFTEVNEVLSHEVWAVWVME